MLRALLLFAVLLAAAPAQAQMMRLVPVDQGAEDASFVAFRSRLLASAAARDTAAVLRAFSPEATISFGGHSGPQGVRELWFSDQIERDEDLWTALVRTVSMGSTARDGIITTPFLFMGFPEDVDSYEHVVVVGEEVRVRNAPTLAGGVLTSLTHTIVPTAYEGADRTEADGYTWVPIRLANGERGWVADTFVWSPLGLRAGFEKRGSTWQILYFVAGD